MARDFTKNIANGLAWGINTMGPRLDGAPAITIAAWVSPDTFDAGANDNRVASVRIDGTTTGFALEVAGTSSPKLVRAGGRSVVTDGFQAVSGATDLSGATGNWIHIGGVLDIARDTIRIYCAGRQDGAGAVTFANAVYTQGVATTAADRIGADAALATTTQFDGRIAEVAIWRGDIGPHNFERLGRGLSPTMILRSHLVSYVPLDDLLDRIWGQSLTLLGAVPSIGGPTLARVPRRALATVTSSAKPWMYYAQQQALMNGAA